MNEGRPAGRLFESLALISKDFTRAQRNSLAKIFFKTGDHEIGQAFVVTFDVSVVGEIGHDDQAKRFGERFKAIESIDLATKFQTFLAAFNPMAFVAFADDMKQLLTAQAV